ncbi:Tigger transposable element-derived protein 1 [Chionoecetes opilio]|uniref:Tigger transposable element-derived protein 1 n=1 Tax=Chionoecetes opilio TaxID=41210 RepID=A0A8J4YDV2_CHIOP|nr:Tigger transposable element-derived protein 1 [Chionoecetes opilio]
MDVLAVIDSGLGWSATGKKFGLHEATVRTIWKTREKIRQSVRESADVSSKWLLWISEQVDQRKSNVDGVAIREKARSIYDHLAEKEPSGSSPAPGFIASHGWFHRFKQRFSLHNIARTGDDADEDDDTETRPVFTIMKLRNLLREADNLTELFTDQDPIQERSIKFKRVVDEGLIPYKETLRSMEASACQKPITAFFKPSPASTPAKKHSTPATPSVTTPARQPVTPATPDNTTSSMSSVSPIPLCGFDDPDDTDRPMTPLPLMQEHLRVLHTFCCLTPGGSMLSGLIYIGNTTLTVHLDRLC